MWEWITKYWIEVLFSGVVAILGLVIKYFASEMQKYKKLLEEEELDRFAKKLDEKLSPVVNRVEELETHINDIMLSYKFRIISLCQDYLDVGSMNQKQYDQLSELYKLYTSLHGNGQAQEYYEKTKRLPIINP